MYICFGYTQLRGVTSVLSEGLAFPQSGRCRERKFFDVSDFLSGEGPSLKMLECTSYSAYRRHTKLIIIIS